MYVLQVELSEEELEQLIKEAQEQMRYSRRYRTMICPPLSLSLTLSLSHSLSLSLSLSLQLLPVYIVRSLDVNEKKEEASEPGGGEVEGEEGGGGMEGVSGELTVEEEYNLDDYSSCSEEEGESCVC